MILILVFSSVIFLPVYAQQTSDIYIFTHVILRDLNGNLVASFEPTRIGYINSVALNDFLDNESSTKDPIMNIRNQEMQIIQRAGILNFNSDNVISDTTLNTSRENGQVISLIRLVHDGLPVTNGDELTTIWTFIRPSN